MLDMYQGILAPQCLLVGDTGKKLYTLYEVGSTTTYFVIDATGVIRCRQTGYDYRTLFGELYVLLSK